MILLGTGDLIDPTKVECVTMASWESMGGNTRGHRAVLYFQSGSVLEFYVDSHDQAVKLRDQLISTIAGALSASTKTP